MKKLAILILIIPIINCSFNCKEVALKDAIKYSKNYKVRIMVYETIPIGPYCCHAQAQYFESKEWHYIGIIQPQIGKRKYFTVDRFKQVISNQKFFYWKDNCND
jgi:hypothetical protein